MLRRRHRPPRGATAIELLTLVAVLAILAALAIPTISSVVQRYRLRGAAWQVAGDARLARQRAVTLGQRVRLCTRNCSIAVPVDAYSVEWEAATGVWTSETGAVRLPPDVHLRLIGCDTGMPVSSTAFTLTGTAGPGTFVVTNRADSYKVIVNQPGRVRVERGTCP